MNQKSTDQLIAAIAQWAHGKGIIEQANPFSQMRKMQEEVGKLWEAVALDATGDDCDWVEQRTSIAEDLGDVLVTAIVQAEMHGLTVQNCMAHAYGKILKRTGEMKGGQFVRDKGTKND